MDQKMSGLALGFSPASSGFRPPEYPNRKAFKGQSIGFLTPPMGLGFEVDTGFCLTISSGRSGFAGSGTAYSAV